MDAIVRPSDDEHWELPRSPGEKRGVCARVSTRGPAIVVVVVTNVVEDDGCDAGNAKGRGDDATTRGRTSFWVFRERDVAVGTSVFREDDDDEFWFGFGRGEAETRGFQGGGGSKEGSTEVEQRRTEEQ